MDYGFDTKCCSSEFCCIGSEIMKHPGTNLTFFQDMSLPALGPFNFAIEADYGQALLWHSFQYSCDTRRNFQEKFWYSWPILIWIASSVSLVWFKVLLLKFVCRMKLMHGNLKTGRSSLVLLTCTGWVLSLHPPQGYHDLLCCRGYASGVMMLVWETSLHIIMIESGQ